jgi:predicted Zn-dependent protease
VAWAGYYRIRNDQLATEISAILSELSPRAERFLAEKVHILSSNDVHARAEVSNRTIHVTTGQLDVLSGRDELAGILAHELSHIEANDTRFEVDESAVGSLARKVVNLPFQAFAAIMIVAAFLGAWFAFGDEDDDKGAPMGPNSPGSQLGEAGDTFEDSAIDAAAAAAAVTAGVTALGVSVTGEWGSARVGSAGESIAHGFEDVFATRYSNAQELRADRDATDWLAAAGFPPDAWLRVLERKLHARELD